MALPKPKVTSIRGYAAPGYDYALFLKYHPCRLVLGTLTK